MSFHRWFAGFFLLLIMIVSLFTNSIMFSARSFQYNLAERAPSTGGVVSFAQLERVKQDKERSAAIMSEQTKQIDRLTSEVDQRSAAEATAAAAAAAEVSALEASVGLTPASAADTSSAALSARVDAVAALKTLPPAARTRVAGSRNKIDELARLEQDLGSKQAQLTGVQTALSENTTKSIAGIKAEDVESLENEANALMASSPFSISARFAVMHPVFLSTLLACSMGALGAILYLFPAYLNPANKITFVVIVVRLVFGMVTALAFYIVANVAGASLTPPSGKSIGNLNPFMVAFLGIIAGIMADEIAAWIMERGREFLGGAQTPQVVINPQQGALGRIADPFVHAARDAMPTAAPPTDGDQPPRGGVQG